jgi:hypothetical protein
VQTTHHRRYFTPANVTTALLILLGLWVAGGLFSALAATSRSKAQDAAFDRCSAGGGYSQTPAACERQEH